MAKYARKHLWSGIVFLCIILATIFIGLPVFGSMRLVDTQIISALERMTGHRASFSANPKIGIFPRLHVILSDLTLESRSKDSARPLFISDSVRLDLSAWAVINGEILVQNTQLIRPQLNVVDDEFSLASTIGGTLYRQLRTAEILVQQNPMDPDLGSIRDFKMGPVTIESGIIRFLNKDGIEQETKTLSAIDGSIYAGNINGPARAKLDSIWRGEHIDLTIDIGNLLSFAAGGPTDANVMIASDPISGSFVGKLASGDLAFMDGPIEIAAPSLPRAMAWLGKSFSVGANLGAMQFKGDLQGRPHKFYFENVEIAQAGNLGRGSMEVTWGNTLPILRGTLDFNALNFSQLLTDVTTPEQIDLTASQNIILDLRLSIGSAQLGQIALSDIASTLQIKPESIAIDLNDAVLFGGQIQAGLRVTRLKDEMPRAELKVLADNVSGAAISRAAEWDGISLDGPLAISLITEGPFNRWSDFISLSTGTISLRSSDLVAKGFSLEALQEGLGRSAFFALDGKGQSTVSVLEGRGAIVDGTVKIKDLNARIAGQRLSLNGLYSYTAQSLALAGSLVPIDGNGAMKDGETVTNFFVGGSPTRPFISPVTSTNAE